MGEMLERVARAIHEAMWRIPANAEMPSFASLPRHSQPWTLAYMVIQAMREPTRDMIRAGHDADYGEANNSCQAHWEAMIDAALSDQSPPIRQDVIEPPVPAHSGTRHQ